MGRQLRFLLLGLGLTYYFNPLYVRSGAFSFARSIHGYVDLSPIEDPDSLQAAVSNVTTDITQLTAILEDFFQRQPDNSAEVSFRELLKRKAVRRHRSLEYYLDWVLGFYKFAWPFVLVYALMRLSTAKSKSIDDNGYKSSSKPKPSKVQKKVEGEIRQSGRKAVDYPKNKENQAGAGLNSIVRQEPVGGEERQIKLTRRIGSAQTLG